MAQMKPVSLLGAVFVLTAALTLAQENKPPASLAPPGQFAASTSASKTTTQTTTPIATTPTPTSNATTTASSNTTTAHTNASTTASPGNATTAHINTTTAGPTTQNTTTANMTTPHTTHTTPQPEPTQKANLTLGNYTVLDGNKLCIMVQTVLQVNVNNSKANGIFIVQPGAVNSTGDCKANASNINLTFKEGNISLSFLKNDTSNKVYVNSVVVNFDYAFLSGVSSHISTENKSVQLFSVEAGHSYSCKSESVFLGDGVNLEFSQQRIQAFSFSSNQFGPADLCKADQPDYSVAIAVGVVLLILIVIVVIAYLISRRKRSDGYQSL